VILSRGRAIWAAWRSDLESRIGCRRLVRLHHLRRGASPPDRQAVIALLTGRRRDPRPRRANRVLAESDLQTAEVRRPDGPNRVERADERRVATTVRDHASRDACRAVGARHDRRATFCPRSIRLMRPACLRQAECRERSSIARGHGVGWHRRPEGRPPAVLVLRLLDWRARELCRPVTAGDQRNDDREGERMIRERTRHGMGSQIRSGGLIRESTPPAAWCGRRR
jgi:hypothetical protein